MVKKGCTAEPFSGSIIDIKVYDRCLSAEEIEYQFAKVQRLRYIQTYIGMVEIEGKHFLSGGSDYCGPIVSEFARNVLWLVREMSQYLDDPDLAAQIKEAINEK